MTTFTAAQIKPKPLKLKPPRVSEKAIQTDAVRLLRSCGYTVLELGQKRRPVICKKCKAQNWPVFTDSTTGTPDIAVLCAGWGSPVAVMLEFKAADTRVRDVQQGLAAAGMTKIVRTTREAVETVCGFERYVINRDPNRLLMAWLAETGPNHKETT